jgi:hypothetical protein
LRHDEKGVTDQKERPFKVDKLGRVKLDALTTVFYHQFRHVLDESMELDQGAWLLVHIMAWFPSRYIFWCDKSDWEQPCLQTRVPEMVSAAAGQSRPLDRAKVTERMLRETTDDHPLVLHHGTSWDNLNGIRTAGGLRPGGSRLESRPIHAETFALRKGVSGDGHRDKSEITISIDPVKLAKACERDYNLLTFSINKVALIEHDVPIAQFQRIEAYGDGSDLTLWCHPGTPTITWFNCAGENCGISLPSGTRICWRQQCLHPVNKQGMEDCIRHFSKTGDAKRIRALYERMNLPVPKAQRKREADAEASTSGANRHTPTHVPRVSTSRQKMMRLAERAREQPVAQFVGTPEARCYRSHLEKYEMDPVYAQQCRDNGHVAWNAKDGILWFKGTCNETGERNVWRDADREQESIIARKQAGAIHNNPQQPENSRQPSANKRKHSSSSGSWTNNQWWTNSSWNKDW